MVSYSYIKLYFLLTMIVCPKKNIKSSVEKLFVNTLAQFLIYIYINTIARSIYVVA